MRLPPEKPCIGVVIPVAPSTPEWQLRESTSSITACASRTARESFGLPGECPFELEIVLSGPRWSWPVGSPASGVQVYTIGGPGAAFAENVNRGLAFLRDRGCALFVILNADAHVPASALDTWLLALRIEDDVAIAGCVSNEIGGRAKVPDWPESHELLEHALKSESWTQPIEGAVAGGVTCLRDLADLFMRQRMERELLVEDLPDVKMVAAAIPAWALEHVGLLDERFRPGNREDVDWCWRARQAGFRTVVCHGVFVHHYGSTSFGRREAWQKAMRDNRARFHAKWSHTTRFAMTRRDADYVVRHADLYEVLGREEPHSVDPLLWHAEAVSELRPRQALRDVDAYLAVHRNDIRARIIRVEALAKLGRHADVDGELDLLTRNHPNDQPFVAELRERLWRERTRPR